MDLYSRLKALVEAQHDPDEDITAYQAAMAVLNALWPTIEAAAAERDRLAVAIERLYRETAWAREDSADTTNAEDPDGLLSEIAGFCEHQIDTTLAWEKDPTDEWPKDFRTGQRQIARRVLEMIEGEQI